MTGLSKENRLKTKIILPPGLVFETSPADQDGPLLFNGNLLPPRQIAPSVSVVKTLGMEAVQLMSGADFPLYLQDGATLFMSLEVTLPRNIARPQVYFVEPEGDITLAGVDGQWQGMDIAQGGTILATRLNTPEEGLTTYGIGLMLDHLSEYALGTMDALELNPVSGDLTSDDSYGPCIIDTAGSDSLFHSWNLPAIFAAVLILLALSIYGIVRKSLN